MPGFDTDGLQFFDLTQPYGHGIPQWPGGAAAARGLAVNIVQFHAPDAVLVQCVEGIMHRGTHMDAPIHVVEDAPTITGYELWRFFGTGVAVSIPKSKWEVVTPDDLEKARPRIEPNDIVMINTGSHRLYGDNDDYFAYSPGLYKEAAEWLGGEKGKMVGIDGQGLDHGLGAYMAPGGVGTDRAHLDR